MSELVSMPTEIVPHLRTTIEEMNDVKEADFAIYQLGSEWGKETVRISDEKADMDELKTKAVLTAVHSGITNIEVEIEDDLIKVTPFNSKIDDYNFLAGYVSGIITELLGEYHIAEIKDDHFEVSKWDRDLEGQISEDEKERPETVEFDELREGESYLIEDDTVDGSLTFEFFVKALEKEMPGLCMTTIFPSEIEKKDIDHEFSTFWLSNVEGSSDVKSITPEGFTDKAVKIATSFLKIKQGIFMLHGIGFLFEHTDPKSVIQAIQTIKDLTSIHHGIFLVAVDHNRIEEKQYNLVRDELEVLEV